MKSAYWRAHERELTERIDKLREDIGFDNGFGHIVAVIGQSAQGKRSCLLDSWNNIKQQWSQELHNSSCLQCFNVLRAS